MLGLLRRFDEPPMEAGLRSTVGRAHRSGTGYRPSWRRRGSPATEAKAKAKRERKAAKRASDAAASKQGARDSYEAVLLRSGCSAKRASELAWARFYEEAT